MLTIYCLSDDGLEAKTIEGAHPAPSHAVWIDLLCPTKEEERVVEGWLGIDVPTPEEMQEIELSSRLYEAHGALFMTAVTLLDSETEHPRTADVTFILTDSHLVTVRHDTPRAIPMFLQRIPRIDHAARTADYVLAAMIDAFLDRIADVLERVGAETEAISQDVFGQRSRKPLQTDDFREILGRIGRTADLSAKARDSLVTFGRVIGYLNAASEHSKMTRLMLKSAQRDANQLSDHASYMGSKAEFLLDATLGLINVEQNNIIKIFSVVSVTLMPPTLIASIYGMNFEHMPELSIPWAYPVVLLAMLATGTLPFIYFRKKGWL